MVLNHDAFSIGSGEWLREALVNQATNDLLQPKNHPCVTILITWIRLNT